MQDGFRDKVAWITGGGSGIGRALAVELARQGAKVAVSGRRQDALDATVAQVAATVAQVAAAGGCGLAVPCDVTDDASVAAAVQRVVAELGRLDVCIANAGCGVNGLFEQLTTAEWRRQLDINVLGVVRTAREALPELRKTQGRLALVGSVMATVTLPGQSAYAASKFAVRAIGLTLAQELAGSGVSCTTVHPGFVESDIARVDNQGTLHPDRPDPRPQALMWTAEQAARVMVEAIRKRRREYVFTVHGKVGAFVGRHWPGLVHFTMGLAPVRKSIVRRGAE